MAEPYDTTNPAHPAVVRFLQPTMMRALSFGLYDTPVYDTDDDPDELADFAMKVLVAIGCEGLIDWPTVVAQMEALN
jgi:hypothetical protein